MPSVYVAGSLRHVPREWWGVYEKIGKLVESVGLTAHVPHIDTVSALNLNKAIEEWDLESSQRRDIYRKNLEVIRDAELIIAEITNPSTGTGIEIGFALELNKKIICLAHKNAAITSMVLGPAHLGQIDFIRYEDEEDALSKLKNLLENKFRNLGKR